MGGSDLVVGWPNSVTWNEAASATTKSDFSIDYSDANALTPTFGLKTGYLASNTTYYNKKYQDHWVTATLSGKRASDSKCFCVFFTDGAPTGKGKYMNNISSSSYYDYDNSRYGNACSTTIGNDICVSQTVNAIQTAKKLKDAGVTIYSILLDQPVPNNGMTQASLLQFSEDALGAISSKYPSATRFLPAYWGTINPKASTENFYQHVTDISSSSTSLTIAFSQVSSSIEEEVKLEYGTETIMNDFINNTYFKLTDAVDPANPWASIKVYKVRCTGLDTDGTTRTFGTAPTDTTRLYSTDGIIINIHKATTTTPGDNDQLKVSGFNYSENWCGMLGSTPHGYKLVVKVPFEFTGGDAQVPGTVETNSSGSGIYPAKKDSDGKVITDGSGNPVYESTPEEEYISPTITFCTLYITRDGLDRGESAIYEVTCDGKFVARVALNGTDDPSVDKYLYGLPGGSYVVTETGWNWAYDKKVWNGSAMVAGNSLTKTVNDPATPVQFRFGGSHKTGTGPEDRHNHDEEYQVNTIDVSGL